MVAFGSLVLVSLGLRENRADEPPTIFPKCSLRGAVSKARLLLHTFAAAPPASIWLESVSVLLVALQSQTSQETLNASDHAPINIRVIFRHLAFWLVKADVVRLDQVT